MSAGTLFLCGTGSFLCGRFAGTYIDYAGTPWVNLEGSPISRKDIEDLAITNPEDVQQQRQPPASGNPSIRVAIQGHGSAEISPA